jgi:aspartyl-tRNA(Asn)/glutamyl-tRNA(Gln) amidotransferase subunit C
MDEKQVRHIAHLARIELKDEEVEKFGGQMTKVLDYMQILGKADTKNVQETSQVTALENVMEEDEIYPAPSTREEMLNCSDLPVEDNQIRVKKTIK